jgi:hypothetical protein
MFGGAVDGGDAADILANVGVGCIRAGRYFADRLGLS